MPVCWSVSRLVARSVGQSKVLSGKLHFHAPIGTLDYAIYVHMYIIIYLIHKYYCMY